MPGVHPDHETFQGKEFLNGVCLLAQKRLSQNKSTSNNPPQRIRLNATVICGVTSHSEQQQPGTLQL